MTPSQQLTNAVAQATSGDTIKFEAGRPVSINGKKLEPFDLIVAANEIGGRNGLGLSHSAVSHQLQLLRERKLVSCRKEGKNVWYSIADEHVYAILRQGISHVEN